MQTLLNPVLGEMSDDLRTNCKACHQGIKKSEFIAVHNTVKTSKKGEHLCRQHFCSMEAFGANSEDFPSGGVDCKCAEARTPTERRNDAHSPRGRKLEEYDKTRQTLAIFWTVVSASCTRRSNELGLRHLQDPRHFGQPDVVQGGAMTPTAREGKDELVKWISRHSM